MRSNYTSNNLMFFFVFICLFLISPLAHAQGDDFLNIGGSYVQNLWIDVTVVLANIAKEARPIAKFVVALSFTFGFCLVCLGIIKLKSYGHNTVMMSTHANPTIPLVYVTIGSIMMSFTTMLNVGSMTVFASPTDNMLVYQGATPGSPFSQLMSTVVVIIQVVGYIAFLRGWFILMKIGSNNSPGTMGKGLVHLLGGILAANIMTTWAVINQTLFHLTTWSL
jgi:intracellular multiplication protein IcmC